jgi:hypothetical protein
VSDDTPLPEATTVSPSSPGKTASGRIRKVPPCKRCSNAEWRIETRPKATVRWAIETAFAAPDVWIFQSESAGWPGKTYELWTCTSCGRTARVS